MTKEEALNKFIERYKSYRNKRFVNLVDCCGMACEICPFKGDQCADDVVMAIIDHFVKAEKKETNLEHYWRTSYEVDDGESYLICVESSKKAHEAFHFGDMKEWLLSPYEKPKYKLTKFEYDLLKCYCEPLLKINDIWILAKMKSTGYFKDIPHNVSIKAILDNCEVIQND